jgi:hypothetical protein
MTKVYIAEFVELAATVQSDSVLAVAVPPLAESVVNTAGTTGAINVLGAITAGAAYVNGQYNNVPLTGGTGSGATANITVAGGGVTVVTLVNRGVGYTAADTLSAAAANLGGSGAGFSIPVTSIIFQIPLQPTTKWVELSADSIASVAFGPTSVGTVATVNNSRIVATDRIIRRVTPGGFFSAITNT